MSHNLLQVPRGRELGLITTMCFHGIYRYTCTSGIAIRLTLDVEMNKSMATLYHYNNVYSIQTMSIVFSTLQYKQLL